MNKVVFGRFNIKNNFLVFCRFRNYRSLINLDIGLNVWFENSEDKIECKTVYMRENHKIKILLSY